MNKKILIISALAEEMLPITQYLELSQTMKVGEIVEHENYIFAISSV